MGLSQKNDFSNKKVRGDVYLLIEGPDFAVARKPWNKKSQESFLQNVLSKLNVLLRNCRLIPPFLFLQCLLFIVSMLFNKQQNLKLNIAMTLKSSLYTVQESTVYDKMIFLELESNSGMRRFFKFYASNICTTWGSVGTLTFQKLWFLPYLTKEAMMWIREHG